MMPHSDRIAAGDGPAATPRADGDGTAPLRRRWDANGGGREEVVSGRRGTARGGLGWRLEREVASAEGGGGRVAVAGRLRVYM